MKPFPTLYLLRHGETLWNRERRVQGHKDSPLTLRGIDQAHAMGEALRAVLGGTDGVRYLTSPLIRSWQTAVIVAARLGIDPLCFARVDALKEMTWGRWDGLTAAEIEAQDLELWQARIRDRFTVAPPGGGETQNDIVARAGTWLAHLEPGKRYVVVTHGAFGRALRTAWEEAPPARMLDLDEPQDALFRLSPHGIERIDALAAGTQGRRSSSARE